MTKLIIKNEGVVVDITGISSFAAPAEVDISKLDKVLVIAELKRQGVDLYEIIEETD